MQTEGELQLLQLQHLQTQALEVVLAQGIPHHNMLAAMAALVLSLFVTHKLTQRQH
jgi:hypothetical protein